MTAVMKNHHNNIFIIFKEGRKWVHAVTLDQPVRLQRLTHDQEANLTPALYRGERYPLARACRRLLAFGRRVGITDGARAALKQILTEEKGAEHADV
jgi:hypothetical protein